MNRWLRLALPQLYMQSAAELIGGGGGGTPSPTPTSATPTPTPSSGTPTPSPTPTSANDVTWLGADAAPELVGYVQNKGWKGPRDVLDSYRGMEKLVGEKRIALPKDEKDEAGWNGLYDSLGRPKTPDEYKLPVPEGQDPKLAKHFSGVFHKAGLNAKQAQAITTEWNQLAAAAAKEQEAALVGRQEREMEAVKTEWGGAFNERVEIAKRGMRTFGIDGETATKLESTMGTKWLMDFAHRIGHALTEHKAEGEGALKGGALTPQQALAEIERLKKDVEWGKKYVAGDVEARARMAQLHSWAHPS